eukprot:jgi/Chlat1/2413/Chrsp17S02823
MAAAAAAMEAVSASSAFFGARVPSRKPVSKISACPPSRTGVVASARGPQRVNVASSPSRSAVGTDTITRIDAREIIDSRGNPTVEVDVFTDGGVFSAAVPSGASTGIYEALELRDKGKRFGGKGVLTAVSNVKDKIAPALMGKKVTDQKALDQVMLDLDGTDNKSSLGANAILGVSLAACRAGASAKGVPLYQHIADIAGTKELVLPVPALNVINGGEHAGNRLAMQEFMLLPIGAESFSEAIQMGCEVYAVLKGIIKKRYGPDAVNVGDEGGFAPNISGAEEGLDLLLSSIEAAGYTGKVKIGMDCAASEFYRDGKYDLDFKNPDATNKQLLTPDEFIETYKGYCSKYPIVSIEDPFDQDDWSSWTKLNQTNDIQIVGDDLTVTNPKRIAEAVSKKACNALLLKVNQIGSVTESIQAALDSKAAGWEYCTRLR